MSTLTYHHGDLRRALLSAAERMIDADVRREFSLRELAREAEVSHAAPYKHFTDRASLVEALAGRWMTDFVSVQEAAATGTDPRSDLLEVGVAYVEWAAAHPSRFAMIFDPAVNQGPNQGPLAVQASRHTTLLTALVQDAVDADALAGPVEMTSRQLWATAHGLATLVILGHVSRDAVQDTLAASLST